jgi:hypothetical protein
VAILTPRALVPLKRKTTYTGIVKMKKLAILTIILIACKAQAYTVSSKTISKSHVNISSGYYFKTNETMVDPDNCGNDAWYKLKNDVYTKEAFSLILAANMSGKKVTFYLNGCASGYPQVGWINVHD